MPGDFHLPYEDNLEKFDVTFQTVIAGAVLVLSATTTLPDGTYAPALVFRFIDSAGQFLPDITLILDKAHMVTLRDIVGDAADAAIRRSEA